MRKACVGLCAVLGLAALSVVMDLLGLAFAGWMAVALIALSAVLIFLKFGFSWKSVTYALVTAGVILRVYYMLNTGVETRQHDLGKLDAGGSGHAGYLLHLLTSGTMKHANNGQWYHPPLYHLLGAQLMAMARFVKNSLSVETLLKAAQSLSCSASVGTLLLSLGILRELRLKDRSVAVAMLALAAQPTFMLLAGYINNDALSVMFSFGILLYALRWYRDQSLRNTACLALCFGLGMMTKLSCGLLALPVGAMMLCVMAKSVRRKDFLRLLPRLCLFAAICVPLGMWYSVRNLILFDQPLGWVPAPASGIGLECVTDSVWERFAFSFSSLFSSPKAQPFGDVRIPEYLLRCSLYGEYAFDLPQAWMLAFLAVGLACALVNTILMLVSAFTDRPRRAAALLIVGMYLTMMAGYAYLCLALPYGCTMDFRYIVSALVLTAAGAAMAAETLPGRMGRAAGGALLGINGAFFAFALAFCVACV